MKVDVTTLSVLRCFRSLRGQAGFSYAEVLIATLLIAVCLAPAVSSLQTAMTGSAILEGSIIDYLSLQSLAEKVLTEPYADLDAAALAAGGVTNPTAYSDPAPITTADGRSIRRLVFIAPYDGDNADDDDDPFTGTDAGLLYVKVSLENSSDAFETLAYQ